MSRYAILACVVATTASAQTRSMFAPWSHVLSVAENATSNTINSAALLHKESGDQSDPPTAPLMPNRFAAQHIAMPANVVRNAFSTGNDVMPVAANGEMTVSTVSWAAVIYSVTTSTAGLPDMAIGTERAALGDGVAGGVFSFVVDGSEWPDQTEVGLPVVTQRNEHINTEGYDVNGIDIPASAAIDRSAAILELANPKLDQFYFSVSADSLPHVDESWWDDEQGNETPPSAASIFVMHWSDQPPGWSEPRVWESGYSLGIGTKDIDALAIDAATRELIFSTTDPDGSPLWYVNPGIEPIPIIASSSNPTGNLLGLDTQSRPGQDDVDALCIIDPDVLADPSSAIATAFERSFGLPIPHLPGQPPTPGIRFGMTRGMNGSGVEVLVTQVCADPALGDGNLFVFAQIGNGTPWLQHAGLWTPTDGDDVWESSFVVPFGSSHEDLRSYAVFIPGTMIPAITPRLSIALDGLPLPPP